MFGQTEIFGKSTNSYSLIGKKNNNVEVNLTPSATFTILSQTTSSFSGNTLTTPNIINEETQIIKAECVYQNVIYTAILPIYIKPLQIIQFFIDGPHKIPEGGTEEFYLKVRSKDGRVFDITSNCEISLESKNCSYRIQDGKLIIGCKEIANDDEVCVVNATYLDSDTNISYYTSKMLYVDKILYNTFKIDFQFDSDDQNTMKTYRSDCLFSLGILNGSYFNNIKFKASLFGPSLAQIEQTKNIEVYEIGTSYLNIETIESGEIGNLQYTKSITLKSLENINGEKEIVLLFVYNNSISGQSIIKPFSVKLFTSVSSGGIQQIILDCSKYLLHNNDSATYIIYGKTSSGVTENITNFCEVSFISPLTGVSLNTNTNTINTTELSNNGVCSLKIKYNNLVRYEEIYFVKD